MSANKPNPNNSIPVIDFTINLYILPFTLKTMRLFARMLTEGYACLISAGDLHWHELLQRTNLSDSLYSHCAVTKNRKVFFAITLIDFY